MRGKARIFWALAGSVGLHALIAYSFWPRTPLRPARSLTTVVHAQLLLPPDLAASTPAPSMPPPAPTAAVAASLAQAPADTPSPVQPHAAEPPVNPTSLPPADQEGYLSIDEVDEPASPIGDWRIDTEVLPHGYTLRLVILVWISATGNVDKWELDSQSGNKAYALKALVDLDRTTLRPAMRNNIAVPSYRRLEIVISHD